MIWAKHKNAQWYLAALSFTESCVVPFPPPDVMLAPMALANRSRAWYFALLTTVMSVLGGVMGYLIGMFAFELIQPVLERAGYMPRYQLVVDWFGVWGVWVVFVAGFSPIPYKLFTIAGGVIAMSFLPFVIASIVGRGLRFFLVAGLMVLGGERMDQALRKYVDRIGWGLVAVAVIGYGLYQLR
jgi:membrane protein YqaA with SNARE-associated domain